MFLARIAAITLVTACAVPEDTSRTTQAAWNWNCEEWGCGMNSPEIDVYRTHYLPIRKDAPAPNGFTVESIRKDGLDFEIEIQAGVLVAKHDHTVLIEHELIGLTWSVKHTDGEKYLVRIADFEKVLYFAELANGGSLATDSYLVEWSKPGDRFVNVCVAPSIGSPDNLDMDPFKAVLFEGDVIDAKSKSVIDVNTEYFNIGCAGHALAKLHLSGHTHAARVATSDFATSLEERTAMLKLFAADYCGTGKAFTEAGQPLQWEDDSYGRNKFQTSVSSLEARWDHNGAVCVENPRIVTYEEIEDHCGRAAPPTCQDYDGNIDPVLNGAYLVSANP